MRLATRVPNRITLYGPNWTDPQPLPVADLVVGWNAKVPGRLSAFVRARNLHRLGLDPIAGRWVRYRHPTQGVWGGVVDDEPATIDEQTVEIAATDMRSLLMDRITPILFRQETATAGAIMRRALSATTTDDPILFNSISADEFGPPLEVEWRGDNAYDLAAALASQSGQEFDVIVDDAGNVDFVWLIQSGEDKRDRVLIRESAHVSGGRVDRTRTTIINDLTGIAANEDYALSSSAQFEIPASIETFGRRQALRRYEGVVTPLTVRGQVRADVRVEAEGWYLPTITMPAMHPVALDIRHGDVIRYWSVAKNRELDFRVLSRAVRNGTVLELAGEAVAVRTPPRGTPTFSPDMLSGLVAWYDADDASTVTVLDGGVWGVADKSNAGHDLGAAELIGSVLAPAYRPNTLNGRAVVDNDGQQEGLQRDAVDFSSTNAMTVYVVARETDTGGTSPVVTFGDLTGVSPGQWEIGRDASDNITATLRGNVGLSDCESTTAWGTTDFHVVTATFDLSLSTNEVTLWVDGAQAGIRNSNSNNTGSFDSSDTLSIPFTTISVHNLWQWAEVLIFDRAHTTIQRQAVWSYLDRWGV